MSLRKSLLFLLRTARESHVATGPSGRLGL
jgi:hypothetical protein